MLLDGEGGIGAGANLGDAVRWTLPGLLWAVPLGVLGAAGPRPRRSPLDDLNGAPAESSRDAYGNWVTTLEVARGLGNTTIYTVEAEKGWYEQVARPDPGQAHFVVYDRFDLEPIGTTGLINIDHRHGTATFGIMLGERRGQGLGTETTRLVLDWAFTVLGLHNVDLVVFAWNRAAIRCYEKAGFREIGRRRGGAVCMGRRFDVVIMDAIAEEFTGSVLTGLVP